MYVIVEFRPRFKGAEMGSNIFQPFPGWQLQGPGASWHQLLGRMSLVHLQDTQALVSGRSSRTQSAFEPTTGGWCTTSSTRRRRRTFRRRSRTFLRPRMSEMFGRNFEARRRLFRRQRSKAESRSNPPAGNFPFFFPLQTKSTKM